MILSFRFLLVPLAKKSETGEQIFEITKNGEEKILAKGGREVREMSTSNPQQIKHRDLLNQANPELNRNLYWSLKFLLMSAS